MTNTTLKLEINSLPKELRAEVANFVELTNSIKRLLTELDVKFYLIIFILN